MLAEWGYNRDGESLEQINLALLTSVASGLPLWYETLAGSMSDRTVLRQVFGKLTKMDMPRFTFYLSQLRNSTSPGWRPSETSASSNQMGRSERVSLKKLRIER